MLGLLMVAHHCPRVPSAGILIAAGSLTYTAFSASRSMPHLFDMSAKHNPDDEHAPMTAGGAATGTVRIGGSGARYQSADASASAGLTANAYSIGASTKPAGPAKADALAVVPLGTPTDAADGPDPDEEAGHAATYAGTRSGSAHAADVEPTAYSVVDALIFLGVLTLASMYVVPVLTNWVTDPSDVAGSRSSPATMWVNIGTQWAVIVLYTWTLIAPRLCPNRDFS